MPHCGWVTHPKLGRLSGQCCGPDTSGARGNVFIRSACVTQAAALGSSSVDREAEDAYKGFCFHLIEYICQAATDMPFNVEVS